MKFRASKEHLLSGLQQVQNIISTRTPMPILQNVLIETDGKQLKLSTTDLDVSITCSVEADIQSAGATTLPAKRLFAIARELPAAEIEVEVDTKNHASIRAGGSFFKILGLPADDFPPLPKLENARSIKVDQGRIKEMLRRTSYAMSVDEARYVLTGILISFKDGKITMVSTDGRRLALADDELDIPKSSEADIVIPGKTVHELLRLFKDEGETTLNLSDTRIAVAVDGTVLNSKLVDGAYPNYRQVIPSETKERVTIDRESLVNALRRVSLLVSDKTGSVRLKLSKDKLAITANTPDVGEASESLAVKYRGRDLDIAFNPEFLMDPLKTLGSDEIHIDFVDELSPGIIRTNAASFLYVIMPMRLA
jgi:DNA polymerase-3 subunit beta